MLVSRQTATALALSALLVTQACAKPKPGLPRGHSRLAGGGHGGPVGLICALAQPGIGGPAISGSSWY